MSLAIGTLIQGVWISQTVIYLTMFPHRICIIKGTASGNEQKD